MSHSDIILGLTILVGLLTAIALLLLWAYRASYQAALQWQHKAHVTELKLGMEQDAHNETIKGHTLAATIYRHEDDPSWVRHVNEVLAVSSASSVDEMGNRD